MTFQNIYQSFMILFPTLMLSLLITISMIPLLKMAASHLHAVDLPNPRKVHTTPMPKVGGIAMALGTVVPILLWSPGNPFVHSLLIGSCILVVFGFLDDVRDMGYEAKLVGQLLAALVVVIYGGLRIGHFGDLLPGVTQLPVWVSCPLTVLAVTGVTNAINLSDGLDGLAGGMTMLIFICLAFVAYQNDMVGIALLSMAVIGAIFGFLRFNTHPAVIFMGDAGSQLLGFLAVTLSLYLSQTSDPISCTFPLLLLGFPILDTLTVMTERIYKRVSPFKADKNHFHHKLMRLGLRHAEAVVVIYGIQFGLVLSAFFLRFHSEWLLLAIYVLFCSTILVGFYWAGKKGWTIKRYDFLDFVVKGNLGIIKKRQLGIKAFYAFLEIGTPLLLFVSCLSVSTVPVYVGYTALFLSACLFAALLLQEKWGFGILRLSLFAMIPYLIFLADMQLKQLPPSKIQFFYHLAFGLLGFAAVMTLKLTRRQKGFKANPFDFLIIFAAFIVTSIPDIKNAVQDVYLITAKMIVLFFAFEVLLGETRGKLMKLNVFMMICLGTVFVKSMIY